MNEKVETSITANHLALRNMIGFRRAENAITKQEMTLIKEYKLTISQFGVLEALYNKGKLRIQDLINKTLSTSGNMTVVIRNMVRDGYIIRQTDENDCRACLIDLTPKGRQIIEEILPTHYDNVGKIFSVLTPQEQEQLTHLLKKIARSSLNYC